MTPTRRQAIAGGIGIATGSIAVTYTGSDGVSASVDSLTISDASHTTDDGDIRDIRVRVDSEITLEADSVPDGFVLDLEVGRPDGQAEPISRRSSGFTQPEETREEELEASVLDHSDYRLSDFEPSEGETEDTDVLVALYLKIEDDGEVVAEDRVSTVATVTVNDPEGTNAEASVSGSGELLVVN